MDMLGSPLEPPLIGTSTSEIQDVHNYHMQEKYTGNNISKHFLHSNKS